MNALERAIDLLGGQSALARACSTKARPLRQSHIWKWLQAGRVPLDHCPAIEAATARRVSCDDLRPDVIWKRTRSGRVTGYLTPIDPTDVHQGVRDAA